MIRIAVGTVVGIEETLENRPDSGVYRVNPITRDFFKPKDLQPFELTGYDEQGNMQLAITDKPIELRLKMNGGSTFR